MSRTTRTTTQEAPAAAQERIVALRCPCGWTFDVRRVKTMQGSANPEAGNCGAVDQAALDTSSEACLPSNQPEHLGMRLGLFPGQVEELKRLARIGADAEQRSRRQWIASAAAVVLVGATAFVAGRWSAQPTSGNTGKIDRAAFLRSRLPLAQRLASAPDAELMASSATFLVIFGGTGGDATLWRGFARLGRMALAARDLELAQGLVQAASIVQIAPEHRELVAQLKELAR